MEKRIELEMRGKAPDQVSELILDNCKCPTISGLTDEFVNLTTLSLINVGLTSLKGFPKLPNLRRLELSDNRISNGLNLLHTSPKLMSLNLCANRIKDLDTLEPLKEFKNLKNLDLYNNDTTNVENYREKVFNLIPSLKYLDGYDKDEKEAEDSEADEEEVNGNEEDESIEEDEEGIEDEEEEDEDDEEDLGLDAVYKDNLEDDSEGEEYEGEGEEEDDDEDGLEEEEDEDDEESAQRGKKRKLEDGGKEDASSKKTNNSTSE